VICQSLWWKVDSYKLTKVDLTQGSSPTQTAIRSSIHSVSLFSLFVWKKFANIIRMVWYVHLYDTSSDSSVLFLVFREDVDARKQTSHSTVLRTGQCWGIRRGFTLIPWKELKINCLGKRKHFIQQDSNGKQNDWIIERNIVKVESKN